MSDDEIDDVIKKATHELTELAAGGTYLMTIVMPGRVSARYVERISERLIQWSEAVTRPLDCHIIPLVFEGGTTAQVTRLGTDPHARAIEALEKRVAELEAERAGHAEEPETHGPNTTSSPWKNRIRLVENKWRCDCGQSMGRGWGAHPVPCPACGAHLPGPPS